MKITYDSEVDVLRIIFSGATIEESDEEKPGIILDFDKDGNVVAMEILDASKRMENPRAVEYAVAGTLIALAVIVAFTQLGETVGDNINEINTQLTQ